MLRVQRTSSCMARLRSRMRLRFKAGAFIVLILGYASWGVIRGHSGSGGGAAPDGGAASRHLLGGSEGALASYPSDLFSEDERNNGAFLMHTLGCLYMFVGLAIVCDEFFVPALDEVVAYVGVGDDVAGATFMAAGGSAPELATSFIGTFTNSSVGFGTIVGSAVFNILFVIGMCAMAIPEPLELTWWPLARDCTCYITSLIVLCIFFGVTTEKEIIWWEAAVLLLLYVGYVTIMAYNDRLRNAINSWLSCSAESAKVTPVEEEIAQPGGEGKPYEIQITPGKSRESEKAEDQKAGAPDVVSVKERTSVKDRTSVFRFGLLSMAKFLSSSKRYRHQTRNTELLSGVTRRLDGMFEEMDGDNAGRLSVSQFADLLGKLKELHPYEWWHSFFKENAKDVMKKYGDGGLLSKLAFDKWFANSHFKVGLMADETFKSIDANGNGLVERDEMLAFIKEIGFKVEKSDEEKVWKQMICYVNDNDPETTEGGAALNGVESKPLGNKERKQGSEGNIDKVDYKGFFRWYTKNMYESHKNQMLKENHTPGSFKRLKTGYRAEMEDAGNEDALETTDLFKNQLVWPKDVGIAGKLMWLVVFPIIFSLAYTVPDVRDAKWKKFFPLTFVLSICWIGVYSFLMVWWATTIGVALGIPDEVMGLTFLAAGTSIPDLLTSVMVAKQGHGDMAVSSSLGSNIFDILVGLPLPWLFYSIVNGESVKVTADSLLTSILILCGMIACVITVIKLYGWKLTKGMGYAMFVLYFLFIGQYLLQTYAF